MVSAQYGNTKTKSDFSKLSLALLLNIKQSLLLQDRSCNSLNLEQAKKEDKTCRASVFRWSVSRNAL